MLPALTWRTAASEDMHSSDLETDWMVAFQQPGQIRAADPILFLDGVRLPFLTRLAGN